MSKKLVLVAAPPACGKNYVSEMICKSLGSVSYLDKDDLSPLLRSAFAVSGECVDMDGEFYLQNLRSSEYDTLLNLAFSALRFAEVVLVNAPFLKEVRDADYMRRLKARASEAGAELILIWVNAPLEVCYERMRSRNSDRDLSKLENWAEYVKKTDYSIPSGLETENAVDRLIVFENGNEKSAELSLYTVMNILGE